MQLTENWRNLIPEFAPPDVNIPFSAFELAAQIQDPFLKRSYLWSIAINNSVLLKVDFGATKIIHVSAGFVHVDLQSSDIEMNGSEETISHFINTAVAERFVFGAYVLARGDRRETSKRVRFFRLGDAVIPIVITDGSIELHGGPPHPHTGTGSCWIENLAMPQKWSKGILTCRHTMTSFSVGTSLNLYPSPSHSSPTSGNLADIDACTIDAAVVEIDPRHWPIGLRNFKASKTLAPGSSVDFTGRMSGKKSGHVLRTFRLGTYTGNLFGQRVISDFCGTNGDSGSLLMETSSGDGAGIYMGDIPDGTGGTEGIFQDLAQASDFFNLNLYL